MKFRIVSTVAAWMAVAGLWMAAVTGGTSWGASPVTLPVVWPVRSCAALAATDLRGIVDTPAAISSARLTQTGKGPFCTVLVRVQPTIVVTIQLPAEHWTQRYIQSGGGSGWPGPAGYPHAGTCLPALNGEFVVGGNNMPTQEVTGPPRPSSVPKLATSVVEWGPEPQTRIDYGYRTAHVTAVIAKALMRAFYGHGPRYAYYMGCSEGGREGLTEAQRYPQDFDGMAVGAPAALLTAQQSIFHLWIAHANRRADGTNILTPEKLALAHAAILAQCDTLSGVRDGLLQNPSACGFNPRSLQCPVGASDASRCLTAEEATALQRLYDGASDAEGHRLMYGLERGGELHWDLPATPTAEPPGVRAAALTFAYLLLPEPAPEVADYRRAVFTRDVFERGSALASLYNATNTDLKAFAAHGGKLILWHGLSDFAVSPQVSVTYYRGVQQFMGAEATERFMRLFLLPGVGHCEGGDGDDQFDTLEPLMAWTERNQAPKLLLTEKSRDPVAPTQAPDPIARVRLPLALPMPAAAATRPVYPYPDLARYSGHGDPGDAANYAPASSPTEAPGSAGYAVQALYGPDNQRDYGVEDGRLVVRDHH
jgi:feruloyl esterase